ncbi:MAG TPA: DUF2325 domain-containing protein [Syntrophomonadaceae bacterium]|nr:DUF2325 domain-containing protein [Syntrophomonadaceae bacterium]
MSTVLENRAETVLLVGADRLGSVPRKLLKKGVKEIIHWNGRNNSTQNREIPKDVDLIILNLSFINHGLMHQVKKQAKARGIPIIFRKNAIFTETG